MTTKRIEGSVAKQASKVTYDKEHPQPNPAAHMSKGVDPVAKYHKMVYEVTSWPLESEKEVKGAFRYFEKTWIPVAEQYLSAGNYSDAVYMSSAFFTQFPDFVERSECQELLSAMARDRRVRKLVRGMMQIGREALHSADNSYLNKIAHSFMKEVRNQPFYDEYRIWTMLEDKK